MRFRDTVSAACQQTHRASEVSKIAGHSTVSVTLNVYADEFDKAMHRDDLMERIEKTGFGAL